jgi:hypothetical protein
MANRRNPAAGDPYSLFDVAGRRTIQVAGGGQIASGVDAGARR